MLEILKPPKFVQRLIILLVLCFGTGCTAFENSRPIAWVDGVPLDQDDYIEALTATHRNEIPGPSKRVDLSEYLNRIIEDRLITQEAYRMGLDDDPWVQEGLREYRLRESVSRLYKEAIAGKVDLSDDDVLRFYRERMEELHIRQITVQKEEDARAIRTEIDAGGDMASLANQHSLDSYKEKGGDRGYVRRGEITDAGSERPAGKKGEIWTARIPSGLYRIMLVEDSRPAPEGDPAEIRRLCEKGLRKRKEGELSRLVLTEYRRQVDVFIDKELLLKIPAMGAQEEKAGDSVSQDAPVARVEKEVLTVRDVERELKDAMRNQAEDSDIALVKDNLVNSWIDRKLVDHFALKQNYERDRAFSNKLRRYEELLVRRAFGQKVILPRIQSSEEAHRAYYEQHRDRYRKPVSYKLKGIAFEDEARARAVSEEIGKSADFSWIVKRETGDESLESTDWLEETELSPALKRILSGLKPGEISGAFADNGRHYIVKLEAKSKIEYEPYEKVGNLVVKDYVKDEYDALCRNYAFKLREKATIKIDESLVRELTERFFPHE
ncbi:MAG: peptidyl-prolyl cis-trans isomerase [Pseudomonadota bacterium]